MTDVVVTLPKSFGLQAWIDEGDAAGDALLDDGRGPFYYWGVPTVPKIEIGERVYVVYDGHLIGYAHLVGKSFDENGKCYLVRRGGAVAVTIDEEIPGFRGYRYRWWPRKWERPFPEWKELAK